MASIQRSRKNGDDQSYDEKTALRKSRERRRLKESAAETENWKRTTTVAVQQDKY